MPLALAGLKLSPSRWRMPRRRPPREVWRVIRREVWERDGRCCTHCNALVDLEACHIDHIRSGPRAMNGKGNLRTLCLRCHVTREDGRHRGMIGRALEDGLIPPDWHGLVWRG